MSIGLRRPKFPQTIPRRLIILVV